MAVARGAGEDWLACGREGVSLKAGNFYRANPLALRDGLLQNKIFWRQHDNFTIKIGISRRRFNLAVTATASAVCAPLFAQSAWPNKPIRIIVPYAPGGFTDQMARLVQVGLQNRLQQTVTIDNKPGANSIIGVDMLAKAPADGSTFAVVIAAYAANNTLYPKLPYDARKDLTGVSLMGISPLLAAVNNDAPFKTAKELIDYARANPGKVSFGSSGTASSKVTKPGPGWTPWAPLPQAAARKSLMRLLLARPPSGPRSSRMRVSRPTKEAEFQLQCLQAV